MDLRFGAWNVMSLCRVGSLKTLASKLTKCNLDLVSVQEVRWDKDGSQPADDYTFFYGNGNAKHHSGTGFFMCKQHWVWLVPGWVVAWEHHMPLALKGAMIAQLV
jgi:exonuclease III